MLAWVRGCRSAIAVTVTLTLVLAACGSGGGDGQPEAREAPVVTSTVPPTPTPKAAPRWEETATFSGTGASETGLFDIADDAIQWRAQWTCETGTVVLTGLPELKKSNPLASSECPKRGQDFAIETGERRLRVETDGAWTVAIEQQVETPVAEAPLAEMEAATVVGGGDFFDIEKKGKGTARLYQLGDGRRVLRLENFEVSHNTDLFVWLSESPNPRTSADVLSAPFVQIATLKSTLGSQNYIVPAEVPTEKIGSVVIWCGPVRIAYTAAWLVAS